MQVKFYNVKKREIVAFDEAECAKVVYKHQTNNGTRERYAACATDDDGTVLTKFLNNAMFNQLNCNVKHV